MHRPGFNPDYLRARWNILQAMHLVRAHSRPSAGRASGTVTKVPFVYDANAGAAADSGDGTRRLIQIQVQHQIQ